MSDRTLAEETDIEYPLWYLIRRVGRPHLPWFVGATLVSAVAATLGNVNALLIGFAFDTVFGGRPFALPLVPEPWLPETTVGQVWFTGGLMFALGVVVVTLTIGKNWLWEVFGHRLLDDARVETFDSAQRQELAFFDRHQTGDVMNALNDDVNRLEQSLTKNARWTVDTVVTIASAMLFMAYINWQLTAAVLALLPVLAGVNYWFAGILEERYDEVRQAAGALNARMETSLGGLAVVKANVAGPFERDRFGDASRNLWDAQWEGTRWRIRQNPAVQSVTGVTMGAAMVIGGIWVIDGPPLFFTGALTAGQLVPFLFYMRDLEGPVEFTTAIVGSYKIAQASARRVVGVRNADERVADDADGEPLGEVEGEVAFESVSFSYPGTDERVLDGVDFTVEPGATVGIVGSTGAGKSTLVKLLLRFYEPDSGAVRVDGRDTSTVTRRSLREAVGYVDQEPFLFDGTVAENIAYGADESGLRETANGTCEAERPASSGVDADIEAAARSAAAYRFVSELPEGYDTQVGERGVKLSGGQRQRIAIARALVGDPDVMVFDEATSHVDNETEVLIQRTLDELTADRTTFVIAHRLSTVRNADEILVLDDGELVERGTHEELLARGGTYANLWHVQVGEIDELPAAFVDRVTVDD
ncbi:ABC transporter ATP-binding protein [Halosimplex marinum]|uniref:ABC transporter ATP-binding protein n=1 Tax=Halosimplex marinum TaxID=3396620 RepID=UPI003F545D64